jgi:hypothetical protein
MSGNSAKSLAKLGLENNGEGRVVTPTGIIVVVGSSV